MKNPKIIAVVGPTSSGKSALGVFLAKKLSGEIISADSRQVYRGLDIGTGKVTKKEMVGVPHHLLDVASPKKIFTVDDFVKLGDRACSSILRVPVGGQKNKIPIVVGGTGLYVDALLGRINIPSVPPNSRLRDRLEKMKTSRLFAMLKKLDPTRAQTIEKDHPRRLIRAIEIAKALGKSPPKKIEEKYDVLWLGLSPTEKQLKKNIRIRLFVRISRGMIAEATRLHTAGLSYKRMGELGLEYRFLAEFLQKKINRKQLLVDIERGNNNYAKRQMRWFRRNKDILWIKNKKEALHLAKRFLSS
jgi:tRNA dimethylallyltransferase